ncbi:eukaryotic translation initiation factor 5B-like [Macadamia integrifolia]|uniref:eukaryotic translation initiation factor 5B-like n=1 Tax=Macadamia integrifolia TaxID=60698 RepID=UPI001C533446|nr:eukaryotic translation initiation factor 5B-like [Macadamia integrifolia]XP_042518657.1 eukaryotic translation initiation factor 5B-like [Macadamia integrifolia]XP_042518658.1 eukaryotic translation initiation factor 5B-like [Macadamia integrifolia]
MGRKKPTVREEENPVASQGGTKSRKKGRVVDDDEYSIGVDLSEDQQSVGPEEKNNEDVAMPAAGKKKGKKDSSKSVQLRDEEQDKPLEDEEEDVPAIAFTGKKKSKSKKGGYNLFSAANFDVVEKENVKDRGEHKKNEDSNREDGAAFSFSGKKKSSKSSKKNDSLLTESAFDALDEGDGIVINEPDQKPADGDEIENDDTPVIAFSGKKKSSKSSKKSGSLPTSSAFGDLYEGDDAKDDNKEEDDDAPVITFSGKKSSKLSKKSSSLFASALLDEEYSNDVSAYDQQPATRSADETEIENDDIPTISLSGKKKSSKSSFDMGLGDEEPEETSVSSSSNVDDGKNAAEAKANKQGSDDIMESYKNKKKKKKGGRTAQEEDDLDKILAELGEGPALPKPTAAPPEEKVVPHLEGAKVHTQPEEVGSVDSKGEEKEAEEVGDSAAAKKKKKKKEKEKEKKAAAAAAAVVEVKEEKQEETKTKVSDKKVPKHVREMQEALARRKEAEERKKREVEERLRKEEEERHRQEELERQAEEARRRKKEREKEKLLKKKQEGKLLTGKQKEEARRLEAMRNQFLAQGGGILSSADTANGPTKRPIYQTKKARPSHAQTNGLVHGKAVEKVEVKESQETAAKVEEVEKQKIEEKVEASQVVEENGVEEEDENEDEDEDEWDAKSWDDAALNLPVKSPFDEEESEPETLVKKETKCITLSTSGDVGASDAETKATVSTKNGIPPSHMKNQNLESKVDHPEVQVADNNGQKESALTKEARHAEAVSNRSPDNLRSPICCIMGHVDTGKTKLLDCIRGTNVQLGEAGGITQQIGATYFPAENIRERTKELKADAILRVPGLLVIDTPGHESFTNLRSRGSGLCDIAILVVDIMHGLEPQTIESLNLLKMRNTEFIVALNKVDRLYGWKTCPNAPIQKALKQQSNDVQNEFKMRLTQIVTQFKEQGMNTELYYKNREMGETFSIVPTSAISGEGIPDLLLLLVQWTSKTMVEKLMFSNEVQCTVLEVKVIEGLGTTIDVVLVNGVLHEGDQIVVCGMQGPIVTTIRALLTPHPMKEIRVKGQYLQHKELKAAQGVKIAAQGLEHAIAGTGLYVVGPDDDVEKIKEAAMQDMRSVMSRIDKSGEGVCVQASTLGSLEALLEFLKSPAVNIPVSGISIGPVHKKDVMRASVMLEKKKEYATILAFDVKVTPEARELAEETGVKIFIADIIYHLFDQFKHYIDNLKEEKKKEAAEEAVFPCVLQIFPNCVFNKKDPIVLGVDVVEGIAKVGTPICIPSRDFIDIGRIASIEINHKQVDVAKKGSKVAIKIGSTNPEEQQKMFGRHFDEDDELVSHITRRSIDVLKSNYRDELSIEEWRLVVKLKSLFGIQ